MASPHSSVVFVVSSIVVFSADASSMRLNTNVSNLALSVFCYLDVDADGKLTMDEWTRQMSLYLGVKQSSLVALSTWGCEKSGLKEKPSVVHHISSLLFIRLGRFDLSICWLSAAHEYARMYDAGAPRHTGSSIAKEDFVHMVVYSIQHCKKTQEVNFWFSVGIGRDRCLSYEEYYDYMERKQQVVLQYMRTDPDRNALADWASSVSIPNFSSFGQNDSLLCVDARAFADHTCESFISSLQNVTAPCSDPRLPEKIADHIAVSTAVLIVAVCLSALCGVASCCTCTTFWIKSRRSRRMLDQSYQVERVLRVKIDAWAILDSNLQAEASSLQPAFKRQLQIMNSNQERLDLFAIVHPDDFDLLLAVRDQAKVAAQSGSNLPALAKVRLQQHIGDGNDGEHCIQYFPAELLLASDSKGQICVGLTALAEGITDAAKADHSIFGKTRTNTEDESTTPGNSPTSYEEMVSGGSRMFL
eukprot:TRINITY_DN16727_c0_g4_i1.p1 TRINITY_DN16727_c0_g4~~TRINITY_DN16727_c0_g4_i1.p1  ORF type:complete len:473 (-),score=47.55 TRINITY_DN16727_c0_g4_i1:249-1667(-)